MNFDHRRLSEGQAVIGDEIESIYSVFSSTAHKLRETRDLLAEKSKAEALAHLAEQVAHDIRSPLSALSTILTDAEVYSSEKSILIRNSVQRITDIANTLLEKGKPTQSKENESSNVQFLPLLIESIVSEKRIQFRDNLNLQIETILKEGCDSFCEIDQSEFKSVISNLMNNSVEAMTGDLEKIFVELGGNQEAAFITIRDNGHGIPENVLPRLGTRGFSFNKEISSSGSGLGIFYAKSIIERFGGKLHIESKVNQGTKVEICLPKAALPFWYLKKLNIKPKSKIVVVDDDRSIHQVWKSKLGTLDLKNWEIDLIHFTSVVSFRDWNRENKADLYLIDYEFSGQSENGLDAIENLKIHGNSVLVTSRYADLTIQKRSKALNLKIIPKMMINSICTEIAAEKKIYDAVLLDDDSLIRQSWKIRAKEIGKNIKIYSCSSDLERDLQHIDPASNFYIDYQLSENRTGDKIAVDLYESGFTQIYLATGISQEKFAALNFLKGVVGKKPVW